MCLPVEALPTIYRLFPQSHVILLQNDPRDLAVSWLQSSFRNPEAMAKRYVQQMALLEKCQAGVPLKYVEVESAKLVSEPGNVLREIISALGLAWEGQVEEAFKTSGLAQVEPGVWRHYETWLKPVFNALEPGQPA